ncbi:MAG: PilZ domain-containing protein [Candidatus Omnitrophica bacterium]|nr:PilZ domain-containing protein [Candidatus Omnitrophota bacterium]MBU1933180.1 PilZ domain-containing protein [Candidatus Omnitrophota bacterium]
MERRRYPRFELKVNAKYDIVNSKELSLSSRTVNISAEGICFECDKALKPGILVNLEVSLDDKSAPVKLIGEIKWSQEIKAPGMTNKKILHGVKLVSVQESDENRFLKYYCDRMVEKLSHYLDKM